MSKLFSSGVPTQFDVDLLMKTFNHIEEGEVILHEDIATLLKLDRKKHQSRYRTIIGSWRRRLRLQHSIIFGSIRGKGFKCLTNTEKVDAAVEKFAAGTRMQQRGIAILGHVEKKRLDNTRLEKAEFLQSLQLSNYPHLLMPPDLVRR